MCFPPGVIEADMKQLNKPKKDSKRGANLHRAKKAKNDEFYTQLSDIETELAHYKDQFKDKIIYCNCDNPTMSNFIKYFNTNKEELGFKQLLTSHYDPITKTGDFRSAESIALLKQADIVITNPPFSLFREYVAQLVEYKKQFLIVGSLNAVTYKEIFPLIKDNKLWLGYGNGAMSFKVPDTYTGACEGNPGNKEAKLGTICWYTNLAIDKRNEDIILYKEYTAKEYPKYDNYDAINVDKVKEIPMNYTGVMGVPITFLYRNNPAQFKIIKFRKGNNDKDLSVNKKCPYFRVLIQKVN